VLGRAIDVGACMRHGFSSRPPLRHAAGKVYRDKLLCSDCGGIGAGWRIIHSVKRKTANVILIVEMLRRDIKLTRSRKLTYFGKVCGRSEERYLYIFQQKQ